MLNEINEFRKEFMGEYYFPENEKWLKELKKQPNIWTITIEENGRTIAFALLSFTITLTRRVLIIEDFVVNKDYRHQGYGKQLLQMIIDFAKKRYIHCIEVATKQDNLTTRKMYEAIGFTDRKQVSYRLWLSQ